MLGYAQETNVLSYLWKHPETLLEYQDKLSEKLFHNKPSKLLFRMLKAVITRINRAPNTQEIRWMVDNCRALQKSNSLVKTTYLEYVNQVAETDVTEVTRDVIWSFIVKTELLTLKDQIDNLVEGSSEDLKEVVANTRETLTKLATWQSAADLDSMFPFDGTRDILEIVDEAYGGRPLPTNFREIDNRTKGGLWPGESSLWVGGTGIGKTAFLISLACSAVMQGNRVVYFGLDNSTGDILDRICSSITGVPRFGSTEDLDSYKERVNAYKTAIGDNLAIYSIASSTVSPTDLRFYLDRVRNKLWTKALRIKTDPEVYSKIDMIIVDYADCLKGEKSAPKDPWLAQAEIHQGLSGIAKDYRAHLATAAQFGRENVESEQAALKFIAGAIAKSFPPALVGMLLQTSDEYDERKMRLAILKNRYGVKNFIVPVNIMYETQRVRDREDFEGVLPMSFGQVQKGKKPPAPLKGARVAEIDYGEDKG